MTGYGKKTINGLEQASKIVSRLLIVLVLVSIVAIGWSVYRSSQQTVAHEGQALTGGQPALKLTPFQHKMLGQGYSRDRVTHRWYRSMDSWTKYGCVVTGPPLEATFSCRDPLQGGIADEEHN